MILPWYSNILRTHIFVLRPLLTYLLYAVCFNAVGTGAADVRRPGMTKSCETTTNNVGEQTAVKRSTSNIESCSVERRSRRVGMDSADLSNCLLDFLAASNTGLGSGEFVRSGSQRVRRRSQMTIDTLNDRERMTPPPTSATSSDSDDPPPSLSRGGPGRWSFQERVASRETPSPPQSTPAQRAKYMATRAAQNADYASSKSSVGRSISNTVTGTECLLDRADYSLEQRRKELLERRSTSPGVASRPTNLDDRQPKLVVPTSGRLSRWSPTIDEVPESSSASFGNSSPRDQVGNEESETRLWGRIFDNDREDEPAYLQRSATLPRRWRCGNFGRKIPNVDECVEEIPESPSVQTSQQQRIHREPDLSEAGRQRLHTVDLSSSTQNGTTAVSSSCGNVDDAQRRAVPHRTLPKIPSVVSRVTGTMLDTPQLDLPALLSESPLTTADDASETSRPTSNEFDDVSTSSSSRDEGFESAVDNGSQSASSSARNYPDFDVSPSEDQPPSSPQEPVGDEMAVKTAGTTPCDGDDSVSATALFARSIDSLVFPHQELVVSGETIDVDHFDMDSSEQSGTKESQSTVPVAAVKGSKASATNKKSLLSNLTARLTRPKTSTSTVAQTDSFSRKVNGANAKQWASSWSPSNSGNGTVAGAGGKSSKFVRGSFLRATMPASLSTRTKSTPSNKDSPAPEPPQRTTSIRDGIQTAQRSSPVTSRQSRTPAFSVGARKPQGQESIKGDKKVSQQSAALPARGRAAVGEQSKEKTRSNGSEARGGRDTLTLYKVVKTPKTPAATTPNTNASGSNSNSRKSVVNGNINSERPRTQRLVSLNTIQQPFRF